MQSCEVDAGGELFRSRSFPLHRLYQASCGVGLGVGLSVWEPDDENAKDVTLQWGKFALSLFHPQLSLFILTRNDLFLYHSRFSR